MEDATLTAAPAPTYHTADPPHGSYQTEPPYISYQREKIFKQPSYYGRAAERWLLNPPYY